MAVRPEYFPGLEKRLTNVVWTLLSGLVFFRVAQSFRGKDTYSVVSPTALVTGLPWGDFDMFALAGQEKVDPDSIVTAPVPIVNPVTPKMLSKYLYWPHRPKVHDEQFSTIPGTTGEIFVIDLAGWSPVIRGSVAFRITSPMTREAALQTYINIYTTEGAIPSLFTEDDLGVTVIENNGSPMTQERFIQVAPSAGWSYHFEPSNVPPETTRFVNDVAIVILNVAKLQRDAPLVGGHKATEFKFTVRPPSNPHPTNKVDLNWGLTASAWTPKITTPPKDKQRISFPVMDEPPSGFMLADFPHPDDDASAFATLDSSQQEVEVTITFGTNGVAPEVRLSSLTSGGGGGGGGDEG